MEWEIWGRALLFLFVWGMGGRHVEGSNEGVFQKLCEITGNVRVLMGKNGEAEKALREALYGGSGKGHFDEDGTFTHGCGLWVHSRSQYCSHLTGSGSEKHGCFGDSLVGTILCTCVPGQREPKDFCGLGDDVKKGAIWTSGLESHTQDLFRKVLEKINKNCKATTHAADTSGHLEDLKNAVNEIKNEAKKNNFSNGKDGHYLGSGTTTTRFCDGMNASEACVTYPTKVNGKEPNIPWADKIFESIQKLNQTRTQQHSRTSSSGSDTDNGHEDSSEDSAGNDEQEGEEQESEEESAQNHDPQNPSKPSRPRRNRRSTKNQPAEQPAESLKAIIHKDDGTILIQPFWLLSAVVI
ncbi:Variant surface glycoprotein [Trypanosoma congolense IL3000]|uniref:Variant surface glycoprotein n=1 Tax=Trypanosoma congolense (strain IL3000) TaxID=1068625 RepID=F9WAI2_TRYCI|nr:Variant surface glycoprotein [Trypanosoma congolense IL3000]